MTARIAALLIAAAAVLALVAAAPASAKGVGSVFACGADGCHDVTDRAGRDESLFSAGSMRGGPPSRRAPFVRVEGHLGAGGEDLGTITFDFVPALAVTRGADERGRPVWYALDSRQLARLRRLVRGVRPFPARRLSLAAPAAPQARVVETVPAPARPVTGARAGHGGVAWWWALAVIGPALLLAAGAARRRLRDSTPWPTSASPSSPTRDAPGPTAQSPSGGG